MAEQIPDHVYGNTVRYLIILSLTVLFITLSLASYSTTGYTLTKYPGLHGSAVVCVEGEVNPTNQSITVINSGDEPTVNPWVDVNGDMHLFNMTVDEVGVRKQTMSLQLGCNNVTYGADSDTKFKVRVEYLSHWRPEVKYLDIGNLQVGHSVRYFIGADDAVKSRLNITDITRDTAKPIFEGEFNGTAVRFKIEEAGNYKAGVQVYDGYVWSDLYEAGFTAHVITTNEHKKTVRVYELEDDDVLEHGGIVPIEIMPDDSESLRLGKRAWNGAYMLVKRLTDLIKANIPI